MTTNNEQNEPRNIKQLLALDSYQTMTDEEIETIIEYKVNMRVQDELLSERMRKTDEMNKEKLRITRESCQQIERMVQSILETQPVLKGVEV